MKEANVIHAWSRDWTRRRKSRALMKAIRILECSSIGDRPSRVLPIILVYQMSAKKRLEQRTT